MWLLKEALLSDKGSLIPLTTKLLPEFWFFYLAGRITRYLVKYNTPGSIMFG